MNSKIGNKRWLIVFLMLMSYAIMYLGRSSMSIAGPVLMKYFGWSASQFGLVSTAFFLGYALTMLPAGWLADRFGSGTVMVIGILFYSVFIFLTPFGATIGLMVLIRALMGVGQGSILPSNGALLAKWIPKKEMGIAQGVVMIGTPFGIFLTMPLAIMIMQDWGWEMVFYLFAFLGPIWCLAWWKYGKNKPELDPTVSKEEMNYIKSDQGPQEFSDEAARVTPHDVFSDKSVWISALSYFTSNYLFFLFMAWLPTYFVMGRGFTLTKSGYSTMLPYFVAMFCYPLGGYLADKAAKKYGHNIGRKLFPVIGLVCAGILLIFGTRADSATTALLLISASNGFLSITQAPFFSMPMVFSPKNAGKIVGLYGFCGTIAGISAPVITGFVVDSYGYDFALYVGASIAVLGAIILLAATIKPVECKTSTSATISAD